MSDEGDDTPARPRRRIRRVTVLSSASDSESDDGVVATTRRKRMRVVSDGDSDSSGSSVVRVGTRRTRALPQLHDSDGASDASPRSPAARRASVPPADARPGASPRAACHASGFASDSSEGNSEKCSICLLRFTDQEVGTPETCEHMFCLDCITEWSRNVNTCPVDRITFNSIMVRACAGGRVLRSEPVVVIERRPSVDVLVVEDPETVCEICGRTDDEDTMLLCDGCDLGYHMLCLTPPLHQVPVEQWLCPNCYDLLDMNLSEVDDLNIGDIDEYMHVEPLPTLAQSARAPPAADEPSTSSGRRAASAPAPRALPRAAPRRHAAHAARRKPRRRTRTVIIEYEEAENGKRPILKRVKRRVKKKKTRKRQPRTAARRTHVRQSVRAKLASMKLEQRLEPSALGAASGASGGALELSVRRQRAGIPALSILGNPNQLDYFSEEEEQDVSRGGTLGVAVRPASYMRDTLRQVRRKMITVSSPPHASAASDILSSILESQTLLHSKNSVVSISVDGNVNIKLETRERKSTKKTSEVKNDNSRINVLKGEDATKKVPSYPGQSRGGGWGGGYRGNYHREQGTTGFGRGSYNEGNYGGNYQNRQGNSYQNTNARRDDNENYANYSRRPHQYSQNDDTAVDRNRRNSDIGRGPNHNQHSQRHGEHGRYGSGAGSAWQPYGAASAPRQDGPAPQHRHSFGGFDNPLDMRTGHIPQQATATKPSDGFAANDTPRRDRSQPYRPLPEPPVFKYEKTADVEKSEDEKSDSSLVIDTDKYDPTEPTRDDDSGDEEDTSSPVATPTLARSATAPAPPTPPAQSSPTAPPVAIVEPLPQEPAPSDVRSALASLDASGLRAPPGVLDSAVRQVLKEHRDLLAPRAPSDDDSDGDCPNFSIYSATSVHIANNTAVLAPEPPCEQPQDNLEDLVQEDDDVPTPEPEEPESEPEPEPEPEPELEPEPEPEPESTLEPKPPARDAPVLQPTDSPVPSVSHAAVDFKTKRRSEEEYKEKVSKRCPITTNTRNPIKIKLNTPSLIKRHVALYDEEEVGEDAAPSGDDSPPAIEPATTPRQASPADKQHASKLPEKEMDETVSKIAEKDKDSKQSMRKNQSEKDKSPITEHDGDMTPEPREPHLRCDEIEASACAIVDASDKPSEIDIAITDKPVNPLQNEHISDNEANSDEEASESGALERAASRSPEKSSEERNDEALEKMTESISETEDERSYTPCLDENKSKDTSLETDKDKGIEGLDTEMISEEEGNEMFSEEERARSESARVSPPPRAAPDATPAPEDEQPDTKKETKPDADVKKKKKKESKKEIKDRSKGKRKAEIAFRKLSKSGKERNYRERDKDGAGERRDSTDSAEREKRKRKRKEKRKDLERYDVRTIVDEKRRKRKDPFGRDVSPRARSRSPSLSRSPPPRRSISRPRRSPSRPRASPPRRPSSRLRRTVSRVRGSPSPARRRRTATPRVSPSPPSPRALSPRRRRRTPDRADRAKRAEPRRRRSVERARKRRRSASASKSPRPKSTKRKKRARSERPASRRRSPRRKSPRRRRARRRSASRAPDASPARAAPPAAPSEPAAWSPGSVDSRLPSPRTPPPAPPAEDAPARRRRDPERARHRRARDAGGASKEVFTSGDNILVSVSFKEQERAGEDERRERRRERRRRRRRPPAPEPEAGAARPVAIIDLERSPFRELTPSPRNVIVLSDSEPGERESGPVPEAAVPEPVGPKTPPEPAAPEVAPEPAQEESRGPNTPPEPPDSPDAYDPYEPTRSASASPSPVLPASPPRTTITLETAQKTNMSADEVLDRRPLSPIEKVMALLQSTREVSPEPPPEAGAAAEAAPPAAAAPAPSACAAAPPAAAPAPAGPPVRIVLPEPKPKLFLAKPSPIKSDPIKPMQAAKLPRPAPADSPYSPGSSDFGELFEPPPGAAERPRRRARPARLPGLHRNKGKLQVGVKIDEDNLKILDDLPSSAVEMQVKSKFLKKLNRQERVVEEVKLVLKPHYNKKHITKEEYKDILRRAVPKICHNKSGEINPTKIQALIEAYVKKIRKKHKLGLV